MIGLADVRILAVEQFGAGPFATLHLADLGAQVLKIEDARTGGDVARHVPPFQHGDGSLFFESFNRNKQSVALDLASPAGREVLLALAADADGLICNLRGDVPEALGLRYADLAEANPRIVVCSLSGYGATGPRRAEPAYDYVVQATAGWMSLTGEPDGPPTRTGLSLVDYAGGLVAALSLLAGIHVARRDGIGGDCDVSLFETALSMLSYPATWWLTGGHESGREPQSAHPSIVPFGSFAAADGWLVLACVKPKFFVRLCEVIGRPDLPEDPRFADFAGRRQHRHSLTAELESALAARPVGEWIELLTAAGVPCGPVNSIQAALEDPQAVARDVVVEAEHPHWGALRTVRTGVRGWWPPAPARPAPGLGADRDAALLRLSYGPEEIAALAAAGAFGEVTP